MIKLNNLDGPRRRRHRRLLRMIAARTRHVRTEHEFRMAERLHRAGLITACVSKSNWLGHGDRPFRELALFLTEAEARRHYDRIVPRGSR